MKILVLGVCGTFMSGIARVASQLGHDVTGVDQHMYAPVKDVLQCLDIQLYDSYDVALMERRWDLVLVANALSRGMPIIEKMLIENQPYQSAPSWLCEQVLQYRNVIAVSGTHGKTTTASLLTHVLQSAGLDVGYLIGGCAHNMEFSASIGTDKIFVIEADEYDTAFFDKQSKFMHYAPNCLIINNIEFDHVDIFSSIVEIKKSFYALCNLIPPNGLIISNQSDAVLQQLLAPVNWCGQITFAADGFFQAMAIEDAGRSFQIKRGDAPSIPVHWNLIGVYNIHNALAVCAAAEYAGVAIKQVATALHNFSGVKRRMEFRGKCGNLCLYDDFAHHPTAIGASITAMKSTMAADARLLVVLQLGSNSMLSGVHQENLAPALSAADRVYLTSHKPIQWEVATLQQAMSIPVHCPESLEEMMVEINSFSARSGDVLLVLGNSNMDQLFKLLQSEVEQKRVVAIQSPLIQ